MPSDEITTITTLSKPTIHLRRLRSQAIQTVLSMLVGSLTIAAGAQLEIKLPFTPVPITGQTLAIAIVGMVLGPSKGLATVALYLAEGSAGLPVFSGGGAGIQHLIGPTGGYLVGFLGSAYVAGLARSKSYTRHPIGIFVTVLAASIPIFLVGVLRLSAFTGSVSSAVAAGLIPFIPGDITKSMFSALVLPMLSRQFRSK